MTSNLKRILFYSFTLCISQSIFAQKNSAIIKPNIIIFYADDLGWQDTQLNNLDEPSPFLTPNLVALAKEGISFTNAYSPAPTCAPSRAAMLTGFHPTKTNITHVRGGRIPTATRRDALIEPFFDSGLAPNFITISETLKTNNYKTALVGKWHAGNMYLERPANQGFDFVYEQRGTHQGPNERRGETRTDEAHYATHKPNDPYRLSDKKYAPFTADYPDGFSYSKDGLTENALSFMDENKEEPFFLYLAHWMVHMPTHSRNKELLTYYCKKFGVALPKVDSPITTSGQTNPYYGAMVTTLDWSLGRIVEYLKNTDDPRNSGKKLFETTYIFFSSDNGGCEIAGKEIITDNFPLNYGKKHTEEGGVRVPMVIVGPNIPKGKLNHTLISQLDFYPTIASLTKTNLAEKHSKNLDGLNITNVLLNNDDNVLDDKGNVREYLWWHFPNNGDSSKKSAIRFGDYKLYKNYDKENYTLYRLYENGKRVDIEEKFDLANDPKYKKIVHQLSSQLESYLKEYKAQIPYKNAATKLPYVGKENAALVAEITAFNFDKTSKKVTVTIDDNKTKISQSYVLGKVSSMVERGGNGRMVKKSTHYKFPVTTNKNCTVFTAVLPEDVEEFVMILVDENQFMIKSELTKI